MTLKLFTPKKVSLSDIASPNPSPAARRAVKRALKMAHQDQMRTLEKAGMRLP
jgi:hypothetical protein